MSKLPTYHTSCSGLPPNWYMWYNANIKSEFVCVQDSIHIGTKLRNRLLNTANTLIIGNNIISLNHLKILMSTIPKDEHLLSATDINVEDRMNFNAVLKISDPRIISLLLKKVPGSEATAEYLNLIRLSTSAIISKSLSVEERLYNLWYCVFFLRKWKTWLKDSKKDNTHFITENAYICIEINAHSLLNLIINNYEKSKMLKFHLFTSQPCESFFRTMRSQTSTHSTVVNFTLFDVFHRSKRFEMQEDIINKFKEKIIFPRHSAKIISTVFSENNMPNKEEIFEIIMTAKGDALKNISKFGVNHTDKLSTLKAQVSSSLNFENSTDNNSEDEGEGINETYNDQINTYDDIIDINMLTDNDSLNLRDFSVEGN